MPYIKQQTRKVLDPAIQLFFDRIKEDDFELLKTGEMNYILTKIIHWWVSNKGLRYENINAAIGILDCAKMELYRCVAAPYEDIKKAENGFISDLDRITQEEKQAIWKCKKCGHIFLDKYFTHYLCPECGSNRDDCEQIRKAIE